jgi:imidazolonepropionase
MSQDSGVIVHGTVCVVSDQGQPRRGATQGDLDIITDGAVVFRDGTIAQVGSTGDVLASGDLTGLDVFDATGMTVLPGLVEAHSHPVFAGSRYLEYAQRLGGASLDEIVAAGGGIWNSVLQTREANDETLSARFHQTLANMLNDGITTLEAKSGYGLTVTEELRELAIIGEATARETISIVPTFLGAHVVPAGMTADAYVDQICDEMLPAVAAQGIGRFCDVTCEEGYFTEEQATRVIRAGERYGLPIRVHADAWKPSRGWALAVETGAHTADHATFATDDEIRASRGTSTMAVLLPVAESVYMGTRRANARLLIENDVPVVIATDYCSSIPVHSLRLAVGLAALWFGMTPGEVIVGATLNAAYALNEAGRAGSLDIGKRADILVLGCEHPYQFVWELGQSPVRRVYKDGRVVVS